MPLKERPVLKRNMSNEFKKFQIQNSGAYEDIQCYNKPHFCPFYRYLSRVVRFISNTSLEPPKNTFRLT